MKTKNKTYGMDKLRRSVAGRKPKCNYMANGFKHRANGFYF